MTMKKLLTILFIICSVAIIKCRSIQAQDNDGKTKTDSPSAENIKKDAIIYNDALVAQQNKVLNAESAIFDAVTSNIPTNLDPAFENLKKQVKESTDAIKKMKAFDGKADFKNALLKLFSAFKKADKKYFPEYIAIGKLQGSDFTTKKADRMIVLGKKIDSLVIVTNDNFIKTQKEFAAKYNFTLAK